MVTMLSASILYNSSPSYRWFSPSAHRICSSNACFAHFDHHCIELSLINLFVRSLHVSTMSRNRPRPIFYLSFVACFYLSINVACGYLCLTLIMYELSLVSCLNLVQSHLCALCFFVMLQGKLHSFLRHFSQHFCRLDPFPPMSSPSG